MTSIGTATHEVERVICLILYAISIFGSPVLVVLNNMTKGKKQALAEHWRAFPPRVHTPGRKALNTHLRMFLAEPFELLSTTMLYWTASTLCVMIFSLIFEKQVVYQYLVSY